MSVEHRPTSPLLLVRLASERPTSRPIILDSFNEKSSFWYAFVTRGPRLEFLFGRIRRAHLPQLSFAVRQFTSEAGTNMTGLDIIYSRACSAGPQRQVATVETNDATQRRNSASSLQPDSLPIRGSNSAPPYTSDTKASIPGNASFFGDII